MCSHTAIPPIVLCTGGDGGSNGGAIAGGIIGAIIVVVLIVLIIILVVWLWRFVDTCAYFGTDTQSNKATPTITTGRWFTATHKTS